jgi:hypothetical protein
MNTLRQALVDFFIRNPTLSEEVDCLPDNKRYEIYTEEISSMSDDDLIEEAKNQGVDYYDE